MFEKLLKELRATGIAFEEGGWGVAPGTDYGTARLDGQADALYADNAMQEQALAGSVHLFTKGAGRTQMAAVQDALNRANVCWRLNSVQFEESTRLTHFEWLFELEAM